MAAELAKIAGAKPPQHVPRLMAGLFAGEAPVVMATESRGSSNAKAKRELGWTLRYPSWRRASPPPALTRNRSALRHDRAPQPHQHPPAEPTLTRQDTVLILTRWRQQQADTDPATQSASLSANRTREDRTG